MSPEAILSRLILSVSTLLLLCLPAAAVAPAELYRAEVIVTGTEEPERLRGFREGLFEVIVKLTGDARLAGDPRLDQTVRHPQDWVANFEYEDRLKHLPVHDEQGTRERPHFLRMQFEPARVDAELQRLGLRKWTNRPPIALWLGIRTEAASYILQASGPEGYGQRVSLLGSAKRRGLAVHLPTNTGANSSATYEDLAAGNVEQLQDGLEPGNALLSGVLTIAAGGHWDIQWRLAHDDRSLRWSETGVTFDVALRNGLDIAALLLSGNAPF